MSGLESHGWGPYDRRGPNCGWRGTIIMRIEETSSRDTIAHPISQPIHYKYNRNKAVEIWWDVDGDVARVSITGGGESLTHNRALGPSCGFQEDRIESNRRSRS